jgi:hypothetical protein
MSEHVRAGDSVATQKQSKTARASVRAASGAANAAVTVLGEYTYLVPLNHGRNAYVRNLLTGRTPNLRTDSDAFVDEIRALAAAGHGARLRAEVESLNLAYPGDGWDVTLKRLDEAEAFSA